MRDSFRADRSGDLGSSRKKHQNLESGRQLAQVGGVVVLGSEFPRHL